MSTARPLSVSVVVPTYDKPAALELTLASLVGQTHRGFDVVVQDDGSPESTAAVLARYAGRLELRAERHANRGRSAARNAALRRATGELVILIDDDRIAHPDFIGDHVRAYEAGGPRSVHAGWQYGVLARWHRGVDISAPRLLEVLARRPELAPRLAACGPDEVIELVDPALVAADLPRAIGALSTSDPWWEDHIEPLLHRWGTGLESYAFPWFLSSTANMSFSRELALEVGGFDEGFRGWGLEDAEFMYRLHRAGAKLAVLDGAASFHQFHGRGREMWPQWHQNAAHFLERHPEPEVALFFAGGLQRLEMAEASRIALALRDPAHRADALHIARLLRAELTATMRSPPVVPLAPDPSAPRRRAF